MSMQQPAPRRKLVNVKTVMMLALLVVMGLFCGFNIQPVNVAPFGNAPLIVVMLICFALGLGMGWLMKSIFHGGHHLAPDEMSRMNTQR